MTQIEALLLSIAVEAPVAAGIARRLVPRPWRAALAASAGTLVTHPLLWLVFRGVARWAGYWPAIAGLEGAVVLIEAVAYRLLLPVGPGRALALSLAANATSYAAGLVIQRLAAI